MKAAIEMVLMVLGECLRGQIKYSKKWNQLVKIYLGSVILIREIKKGENCVWGATAVGTVVQPRPLQRYRIHPARLMVRLVTPIRNVGNSNLKP